MDSDRSLELLIFNVVELLRRQEEVPVLADIELVVLAHLERVNNVLILIKLLHDCQVVLEGQVVISERNWANTSVAVVLLRCC